MISNDTIVAPATPFGFSGLAIVRVSGERTIPILSALTDAREQAPLFTHKSISRVRLFSISGVPFDEAVVSFFQKPQSYTGEDLAEISCHGNPAIIEEIITTVCFNGARIAEPGEFTKRAFLNGKVDLTQAEAVANIIESQTIESAQLNHRVLHGELSKRLMKIKTNLIECLSHVEFEIDISEDEVVPEGYSRLINNLETLIEQNRLLLKHYRQNRLLNKGALVVIVGKPNVGKSTLLNALSNTNRAITHHLPGTTRDAIDVSLVLSGTPIRIVDTAGIRDTRKELENEGIKRTKNYIQQADLILSVVDNNKDAFFKSKNVRYIKIKNKTDLNKEEKIKPGVIPISAINGTGLSQLKREIKTALGLSRSISENALLISSRQKEALSQCLNCLVAAKNASKAGAGDNLEIVALELRDALNSIDRVLGKTTADDILENIFGSFCVGK